MMSGLGIEFLGEERLPSGKYRVQYRFEGVHGAVLATDADEAFEQLYLRWGEQKAIKAGLGREAGREIAKRSLAALAAEHKEST